MKRVASLTKHVGRLEAHKMNFPTGYWKPENAKGGVLDSLCTVFSIPAKKADGTTNKADDKRLALGVKLGSATPRAIFDVTLVALKLQLMDSRTEHAKVESELWEMLAR
jgi:hypothetical protein